MMLETTPYHRGAAPAEPSRIRVARAFRAGRRSFARCACIASLLLLGACEGLFTGARESQQPLTQLEDGSYAPVRLPLDPDMNPIAFNLKGSTVAAANESGRWNTYQVVLARDGVPVASGRFNVNNAGTKDLEEGGAFSTTMLFASVPASGEYELRITPARPNEITIESPQLEVRRNTQMPPTVPSG